MTGHSSMFNLALRFMLVSLAMIFTACANYYQNNYSFNEKFEQGELHTALETLKKNSNEAHGKNRFIYYSNKGLLLSVLGKYAESNESLEKAFLFGEDYRINYIHEAASYLSNPMLTPYRGEDHEHLMVLYFKALNFLKMNKPEEALVECRRLNIRLNQLSDKYNSEKKLQRDAFIHTLMGIIYQSSKDYNNAFIAYRNAVEVYEKEYSTFFNIHVPEQLKKDLLNTAYWTGFMDEFNHFKNHFNMAEYKPVAPEAELVFFWHNGLAPVKEEWSVNFVIDHQSDNLVLFRNESLGINFPFNIDKDKEKRDLSSLEVFRVAFPKYAERSTYYKEGVLEIDSAAFPLELTEDINQIAFYSLKQRMVTEMSKGLLRAALKKASEHSMREEDERLGALIGLVNAITEKADTRNWQTLPHSIHFARVPLQEGENPVKFKLRSGEGKTIDYQFTYQATKGQTLFHTFSSLETMPMNPRYY
ncbi:MAG TPA: hypothetical protein VD884_12545 [Ohtaekwangia sp.]|nr:hypothetical protein [Ohtaekwangia sp.]